MTYYGANRPDLISFKWDNCNRFDSEVEDSYTLGLEMIP